MSLGKITFNHNAVAAYYAVTLGEPGVAVIAGTGAIALGMNRRVRRLGLVGGVGLLVM